MDSEPLAIRANDEDNVAILGDVDSCFLFLVVVGGVRRGHHNGGPRE